MRKGPTMRMRSIYIIAVCAAFTALGARSAPAGVCLISGPTYNLMSDTIYWSMRSKAGQDCVRGLRGGAMILKSVELITAPKFGDVAVNGPSFVFTANPDAAGEDSFSLKMSGSINGLEGTSMIVIRVLYNDASPTASSTLRSDNSTGN